MLTNECYCSVKFTIEIMRRVYDVSRGHPVFLLSGALMSSDQQCDGKVL